MSWGELLKAAFWVSSICTLQYLLIKIINERWWTRGQKVKIRQPFFPRKGAHSVNDWISSTEQSIDEDPNRLTCTIERLTKQIITEIIILTIRNNECYALELSTVLFCFNVKVHLACDEACCYSRSHTNPLGWTFCVQLVSLARTTRVGKISGFRVIQLPSDAVTPQTSVVVLKPSYRTDLLHSALSFNYNYSLVFVP